MYFQGEEWLEEAKEGCSEDLPSFQGYGAGGILPAPCLTLHQSQEERESPPALERGGEPSGIGRTGCSATGSLLRRN